jgi:hypothetical protein
MLQINQIRRVMVRRCSFEEKILEPWAGRTYRVSNMVTSALDLFSPDVPEELY